MEQTKAALRELGWRMGGCHSEEDIERWANAIGDLAADFPDTEEMMRTLYDPIFDFDSMFDYTKDGDDA